MKNPIYNALAASAYIIVLDILFHFIARPNTPDTGFEPVIMLSVFVFSAAVMGYLFIAEPVRMYIDGKKQEATSFFLKTLGSFGILTLIFLIAYFFVR